MQTPVYLSLLKIPVSISINNCRLNIGAECGGVRPRLPERSRAAREAPTPTQDSKSQQELHQPEEANIDGRQLN